MAASHANGVEMLSNPVTCTSCHKIPTRSASSTLAASPRINSFIPSSSPRTVKVRSVRLSEISPYLVIGPEISFGNMLT